MNFRLGDRNVLCIDWDERSLRVVDASLSRSGVRIRSALHVRLAPGTDVRDPASLGNFIQRTLGEHRMRTRRAIVDIPRQDAVLNLLSLPDAPLDELAAMVHIQIAKELPFSKDQAVIDFARAHEKGAGARDVWVGAVRNNVMDHYRQVIATAGLRLERIGLRPYANLVAVTASAPTGGRTLVVDVGPSLTEITVIRDGRLVYSRAASVSVPAEGLRGGAGRVERPSAPVAGDRTIPLADDFVARPGPMDALLIEVSRTIEAYRVTDPGSSIDRIVLAGTAGIDQHVADAFRDRFGVPAALYEAPQSLQWRGGRETSAVPFSAVIGLALSNVAEGMETFDFLHPKEPEAGRRERARRVPIIAATVGLFIAAGGVAAYQPIRRLNAEIDDYKTLIDGLKKDEKQRDELMYQWEDVQAWRDRSVVWLDSLKRLAEVFPSNKDAYVTKLECKAGKDESEIVVELVAADRNQGTAFAESLNEVVDETQDQMGSRKKVHLFHSATSSLEENKDPKYPFRDKVTATLRLADSPAAPTTRRAE